MFNEIHKGEILYGKLHWVIRHTYLIPRIINIELTWSNLEACHPPLNLDGYIIIQISKIKGLQIMQCVVGWLGNELMLTNPVIFGLNHSNNNKKQKNAYSPSPSPKINATLKRNYSPSVVVFNKSLIVEWPAELTKCPFSLFLMKIWEIWDQNPSGCEIFFLGFTLWHIMVTNQKEVTAPMNGVK